MNSTLTTWRFLIKAPYLGKLSVIYDTENKGLSHFFSDENKGLKSIAEIRCSVIKSLITHSMASIRLVTGIYMASWSLWRMFWLISSNPFRK